MKLWRALLGVLLVSATVAACASGGGSALEPDTMATAAAEATAIVQQARATALVLQAQTMATALIEQAGAPPATPPLPGPTRVPVVTPTPARPAPTLGAAEEEEGQPSPAIPATPPAGEGGEEATPEADSSEQ